MPEPTTLSEAFSKFGPYPSDHPQTMKDLVNADPDTVHHPLAWFLRAQAVAVSRSAEAHYVNSPKDAFTLLRNKYVLHPWTGKWTTYAMTGSRQVAVVPHPKGGTTPLRVHTAIIPKFTQLPSLPYEDRSSSRQPAWLVIYGGTPEVLSKPGVARGLATLLRRTPVADVLFYTRLDPDEGLTTPTMWSIKAGVGMSENGGRGKTLQFPQLPPDALEELRRSLK